VGSRGCPATTPTVVNNPAQVLVGRNVQAATAITLSDGTVVWRFEDGGDYYGRYARQPFVVDGGTVHEPNFDGTLYAVDRETGNLEWRFRADDRLVSAPVVDGDTLYVASESGTLYAVGV
jgi:hypothetical protein